MTGSLIETNRAALELNRMVLEQVITHFVTNFEAVRKTGSMPAVHIWIEAQDDLSRARIRKRVRQALYPFLKNVLVEVSPNSPGAAQ